MNLLYDFISSQDSVNGGSEYCVKIFETMQKRENGIEYYCLFDRHRKIAFPHLSPEALSSSYQHIHIVWYDKPLADLVEENKIDKVYLAIGQRYCHDDSWGRISCPVVMTIHDAGLLETVDSHLYEYLQSFHPVRTAKFLFKQWLKNFISRPSRDQEDRVFFDHLKACKNLQIVAVSEYTKNAILMYGGLENPQIEVCWSPAKIAEAGDQVEDDTLRQLIDKHQCYVLMVNVNRGLKNGERGLEAFRRYKQLYPSDIKVATVGYRGDPLFEDHVILPFLSESDLENAYRSCRAFFYPSLFEGFGYPPVEAMKYGAAVLSSNVTSMPEVLGDAAVWFSPFYEADMVRALHILDDPKTYSSYRTKAVMRSENILYKQIADLEHLCKIIEKQ